MEAFTSLTAIAVPVDLPNVDTDQIIPARFLGRAREEQAPAMFHDMRRAPDGNLRPDFPLNQAGFAGAGIIVAGRNFACGSSRENAVTVMVDNGFRAFIAPSFGDIFFNNCFQNGALPIMLPEARVAELRSELHARPGARITVDLAAQTVTGPDGKIDRFEIDSFRKDCLLRGVDSVTLTLSHEGEIAAFEARQKEEVSWL
ncbi:MAG: 3-isopropylmalate dehydratase small subunit [Roseomonas sp.]|nr:3-isopropylmalate dehydratase small subunit [Roseomonas sp.]MCA3431020.1 3-isopropylmalate dehydratase small subunit [Roseomonas sp.]MCA3434291.1 3-isopropylmalate dehydratase small subunit [Roseomonas sp.]